MKRSVVAVLATGLALICIVVIVVLAHSPLTVAGTNPVPREQYIELEKSNLSTCQAAGIIPRGTSAVRIGIEGDSVAPAVTIRILTPAHALIEGWQAAGQGADPNVTVHVKRFARSVDGARVCTTVAPLAEPIRFYGRPRGSAQEGNRLQDALLSMEYLRSESKSWWSLLPSILHRMGFGHTPGGASSVIFVIAFMLALVIVTIRLVLKDLR
jgi:hypothetical protein